MDQQKNNGLSYVMLISSLLILGTIGILRRYIPISSAMLAFFRGVIGSASLFLFVKLLIRKPLPKVSRKQLILLLVSGAFIGMNWLLLFEAFNNTTIATATLCYYMEPTIVLVLSPIFFKETLTPKKLLCAVAALIGMVLVSGVTNTDGIAPNDQKGIMLALLAACFYAAVIILNKKIEGTDIYKKTIYQLLAASLMTVPYIMLTEDFSTVTFDAGVILLILVVGVIYTGFSYLLYFKGIEGLSAQTVSTLSYIDPVTAMVASALILHESMTLSAIIGAVLIIGSALICELPAKTRVKQS